MQNLSHTSYINRLKVINIKSETLFREAEDDFYYFNNVNSALKKLKEALKLTPYHKKSLILAGDIYFIKGQLKKALKLYINAYKINSDETKIQASICNSYYALKDYNNALKYCNKALKGSEYENTLLYSQLTEIKINILIELKQYNSAYKIFTSWQTAEKNTNFEFIKEKIELQNKLKHSRLKIV